MSSSNQQSYSNRNQDQYQTASQQMGGADCNRQAANQGLNDARLSNQTDQIQQNSHRGLDSNNQGWSQQQYQQQSGSRGAGTYQQQSGSNAAGSYQQRQ